MKIDGACLCGAVRYEAEIDPAGIMVCHCRDCQVNGGGAYRWGVVVPKEQFRLLAGTLKTYRKQAASGNYRDLAFCPDCGTSLYGTQADAPVSYSLRLSTARQSRELAPKLQIWTGAAYDWVNELERVPGLERQS
jgi:hypothetical protein